MCWWWVIEHFYTNPESPWTILTSSFITTLQKLSQKLIVICISPMLSRMTTAVVVRHLDITFLTCVSQKYNLAYSNFNFCTECSSLITNECLQSSEQNVIVFFFLLNMPFLATRILKLKKTLLWGIPFASHVLMLSTKWKQFEQFKITKRHCVINCLSPTFNLYHTVCFCQSWVLCVLLVSILWMRTKKTWGLRCQKLH